MPSHSESASVSVRKVDGWWNWSVTDTESRPPSLIGMGTAPDRGLAWAAAATVIADQGEVDA